jgi:hypothetical protein
MADGTGRLGLGAAVVVALAAGAAAGWLIARAGAAAPPEQAGYTNPLADARPGESVALRRADGTIFNYRVQEADVHTVLLLAETQPPGEAIHSRQLRISRSWFGSFLILEGDVDRDVIEATTRDFVLDRVTQDVWTPPALGRPLRCWKFEGRHRVHGEMKTWVSDEIPVHGAVRVDGPRGILFEYHGSREAP